MYFLPVNITCTPSSFKQTKQDRQIDRQTDRQLQTAGMTQGCVYYFTTFYFSILFLYYSFIYLHSQYFHVGFFPSHHHHRVGRRVESGEGWSGVRELYSLRHIIMTSHIVVYILNMICIHNVCTYLMYGWLVLLRFVLFVFLAPASLRTGLHSKQSQRHSSIIKQTSVQVRNHHSHTVHRFI
jgi:hypothetical protein